MAPCAVAIRAARPPRWGPSAFVKHPDLLIAAAAEAAGVTVLHYDEDYDRIAEITGQPTCWLAPTGSLR
jgi:predicted nucleic acid-binding protein